VITSDHGSTYIGNIDPNDHKRFQIPLLFWGPAINKQFEGKSIDQIGNSFDIPATILTLLNINFQNYSFSRNLLYVYQKQRAYWITEHTLGWINEDRKIVINHDTEKLYFNTGSNENISISIREAMLHFKLCANYVLK